MSIERVREYLKDFDKDGEILEFAESTATVDLAAAAVGVEPARIAKTMGFYDGEDNCIMVVTAGDARVDNKKFKAEFGIKAKMLKGEDVLRLTSHEIGGVCPFAVTGDHARIYLDDSMKRFETVFPAAGNDQSAVEFTLDELFVCAGALGWVDVCKLPA